MLQREEGKRIGRQASTWRDRDRDGALNEVKRVVMVHLVAESG